MGDHSPTPVDEVFDVLIVDGVMRFGAKGALP
jgi:hypothetical protein